MLILLQEMHMVFTDEWETKQHATEAVSTPKRQRHILLSAFWPQMTQERKAGRTVA
jgi:hypothetical protein